MATAQDLDAITAYIESKRSAIPEYKTLLGNKLEDVINEYEQWRAGLTWYGLYVITDSTIASAKWYRDKVNQIMGNELPAEWVSADAEKAAETKAAQPTNWNKLSASTQLGIIGAGVAAGALLILSGPLYFSAYMQSKVRRLP